MKDIAWTRRPTAGATLLDIAFARLGTTHGGRREKDIDGTGSRSSGANLLAIARTGGRAAHRPARSRATRSFGPRDIAGLAVAGARAVAADSVRAHEARGALSRRDTCVPRVAVQNAVATFAVRAIDAFGIPAAVRGTNRRRLVHGAAARERVKEPAVDEHARVARAVVVDARFHHAPVRNALGVPATSLTARGLLTDRRGRAASGTVRHRATAFPVVAADPALAVAREAVAVLVAAASVRLVPNATTAIAVRARKAEGVVVVAGEVTSERAAAFLANELLA